jgi:hypothetical protein
MNIKKPVSEGFLYISNSNSFSLWCVERSRKIMGLCNSFPIVNFMVVVVC